MAVHLDLGVDAKAGQTPIPRGITVIDLTGGARYQPPGCGIVARANGGVNGTSRADRAARGLSPGASL
jgi:hypothetical protein